MARIRTLSKVLLGASCAALMVGTASAAVITNRTPVDFTGGSVSIGFGTQDITFSDNGTNIFDFNPVSVATSGGGAVTYSSFFGVPFTYFDAIRGSGSLTFGSTAEFSSLPAATVIPYSATPFIIGLADTTSNGTHYGYGEFAGTSLVSYGFESVPGQAITISNTSLSAVPLPASAPMFGAALLAFAGLGYGVKRKKAAALA
ncbi:hypothetical protein [Lichenifustis flavocetrariae]|uniref:VPLPA-CTERM sorting domain-containing protein n=1 Tax=Lichenifustis flavocetrariae TaxID=2949735 RepID=A0AA41YXJ7_9HYPH|nr:hypothetical protein [Lichenifustis flavocetrariae]MCW6506685.1 hypothetical protein [Lichenifustis flavocetrariae]